MSSMLDQNTPHILSSLKWLIKLITLALCTPLVGGTWAEQKLEGLSQRDRIAQLFMIPVCTEGKNENVQDALTLIDNIPVGGIIFMQGTIASQTSANQKLQEKSPLPLIVGQDNEWGVSMRLKDALRLPRNLMLGALSDEQLLYQFGQLVGEQCKAVGVHVNFAPVVDVNNNPANPVINDRAFGEDAEQVARSSLQVMKGMQNTGILTCAKHFPGHGDTHVDSHFSLPVIEKDKAALSALEWLPYKRLIDQGLDGVMMAHLIFPLIADTHPSSLSTDMIEDCLKNQLGFTGLVFTDSLIMKAITDNFDPGYADLLALKAGNDIIVMPKDIETSISRIEKGLEDGEITLEEIDKKALKVLETKEKLGLNKARFTQEENLFSGEAKHLKKRLFSEAITLIENKNALPLDAQDKIAFVQIGRDVLMRNALELVHTPIEEQTPDIRPPLYGSLSESYNIDYFFLPKSAEKKDLLALTKKLQGYTSIVVGVYEMNKFQSKNYGLCPSTFELLDSIENKKVYLSLFGSPYSLKHFERENVILMGYENDPDAQLAVAEILKGERVPSGQLPITASEKYPRGYAFEKSSGIRVLSQ